ncbi:MULTISPECIES: creatininase family protein [Mycobacteriaceae]|uniref:creatininase family protein n=1 Tax=Mycobacteriaceae TaxID=1762 RepID=UPI000801CD6D|nr:MULTISPECIES: creatininase family protein [Mycobacteriaceae]MCK0175479.1 creatininase family protein [Mycolicibacterium sp. F2034L]OBB59977.1 creatininase [Mycobacterium sp. 852013-51886_SCH5428379]
MPRWCDLTRDEVAEAARSGAVAVLPLGAIEQHGAHLPTGTDALLAGAAADAAVTRTRDIVLPAVVYGCSLGHTAHWPGTLSLSVATLTAVVTDIGRWVVTSGFQKLVVINSHATNGPSAQSALLTLRHEHPSLRTCFASLYDITAQAHAGYFSDADDPHANAAETSMVLHLDPGLVSLDRAVDEEDRTLRRVLTYSMPDVTRSGVVGRPTSATTESGAALFAAIVDGIARLLEQVRAETDPIPDRPAEPLPVDHHPPSKGPS